MPKLIALARRRTSGGMPFTGTPNISEAVLAWMSVPSRDAWRSVGVGGFELRHLPPFEDALGQLVALLGELLEHVGARRPGAGRGLGAAGQLHLAEQDVAELFWAAEIEALARELRDLVLEPRHG